MMIAMHVSLGGQPLAILDGNARYTGLNLCLRGYDKSHNPESHTMRDRGNAPKTRRRAKPGNSPECSPNHPALRGTLALRAGRRSAEIESFSEQ